MDAFEKPVETLSKEFLFMEFASRYSLTRIEPVIDISSIISLTDLWFFNDRLGRLIQSAYMYRSVRNDMSRHYCYETSLGRLIFKKFRQDDDSEIELSGDDWLVSFRYDPNQADFPYIVVSEAKNLEDFQYELALLKVSGEI